MLSAIAARKAAQAAKSASVSQTIPATSESVSIPEQDSGLEAVRIRRAFQLQKATRKRKPTEAADITDTSTTRTKQRRKPVNGKPSQNRYYEPDSIIIGAEEVVGSSSSSTSDSGGESGKVHFVGGDIDRERHFRKSQRAWSPSRPLIDSSDDELEIEYTTTEPPVELPTSEDPAIAHLAWPQDGGYPVAHPLSFIPQPRKNIFYCDGLDTNFLSGRKGTIVALQENETLALIGTYSLTVLRGTVSVMCFDAHASESSSHYIFAPKCSPIPILRAIGSGTTSSCALPDSLVHVVDPKCTVIFIEDSATGVEGLGQICKTFENVFETSLGGSALNLSGASLVRLPSIGRPLQPFQVPESWLSALATLPCFSSVGDDKEDDSQNLDRLSILVRGQKRTGKSALARSLVNKLLCRYQRVAFVECDIGQTEFTPPGLISLHVIDRPIFGPPFTHPLIPYASHFIGASSPRNDPTLYISAVSAVLQTYRVELQYPAPEDELHDLDHQKISDVIPLIVNTMGWMKGLGADLSRQIGELMEPTHIFCTQSSDAATEGIFPARIANSVANIAKRGDDGPNMLEVEAIPLAMQFSRYSAADWRALSLMSYFHCIPSRAQYTLLPTRLQLPGPITCDSRVSLCIWDCRTPLVAQAPFAVSPSEAIDRVVLVGAGTEDVVPAEIARVLNGAIVALVACQEGSVELSEVAQQSKLPYYQGHPAPDPSASFCVGLALVRGISPSLADGSLLTEQSDASGEVLHLLTPVPPELVGSSGARWLVKGEIELPVWGMLDFRDRGRTHDMDNIPYLQFSKSDAMGAERRRVRRNIMRRGQM